MDMFHHQRSVNNSISELNISSSFTLPNNSQTLEDSSTIQTLLIETLDCDGNTSTPPTLSPLSDISYDEDIIDDQPAIATVSTRPTELSVDTLIHDENSLYLILENASIDLRHTIDVWIALYKTDRQEAIARMITLIINMGGYKDSVTVKMHQGMTHEAIVNHISNNYKAHGKSPLLLQGQRWTTISNNYSNFLDILVKKCQYSIIYDNFMFKNIISILICLSNLSERNIRHTATYTALKLNTSIVNIAVQVSENCKSLRSQSRLEESVREMLNEQTENEEEIYSMLKCIFKKIFARRFKDVSQNIRAMCMKEIGIWMCTCPSEFMDDYYLKYFVSGLYDEIADVRLIVVQSILVLYEKDDFRGKLTNFTNTIKDRVLAMTLDRDFRVEKVIIKLVALIHKLMPNVIKSDDLYHVSKLIFSCNREVAVTTATEILDLVVFKTGIGQNIRTKSGKRRLLYTSHFRDLISFFIETKFVDSATFLVDALIDTQPMMKDWECMTDLLLEEPGEFENELTQTEEAILIDIMTLSIIQTVTGISPRLAKSVLSAKKTKQTQKDRTNMTEHFIKIIHMLLLNFRTQAKSLINLFTIVQYFDLEVYTFVPHETLLDQLFVEIREVLHTYSDDKLIETCSKTMAYLCSDNSITFKCSEETKRIIESYIEKFKCEINDWEKYDNVNVPDDDLIYDIVSSIKKLSIFSDLHYFIDDKMLDSFQMEVYKCRNGLTENCLPSEAIRYCLKYHVNYFVRSLSVLENHNDNSSAATLRMHLEYSMTVWAEIVSNVSDSDLCEAAFCAICKVATTYNHDLNKSIESCCLVPQLNSGISQILKDFLQSFVFDEHITKEHVEEETILDKRRNVLAAFCKIIIHNILPIFNAEIIFRYYAQCHKCYGELIKELIAITQQMNIVNCAMTMCFTLTKWYRDLQNSVAIGDQVSTTSNEFKKIKNLGRMFALSFGLENTKYREGICSIHKSGILFALEFDPNSSQERAPSRLPFLEILTTFCSRLLEQDKQLIWDFVKKNLGNRVPSKKATTWQCLFTYGKALGNFALEDEGLTSTPKQRSKEQRRTFGLQGSEYISSIHSHIPEEDSVLMEI